MAIVSRVPATLIAALAAGKKSAKFIAQYLESGECHPEDGDWMEKTIAELGVFDYKEKMPFKGQTKRAKQKAVEPEIRIQNFEEVEAGIFPGRSPQGSIALSCAAIGSGWRRFEGSTAFEARFTRGGAPLEGGFTKKENIEHRTSNIEC